MRIIYDISVLGVGFSRPRARTGVFRVVESLGQALVHHGAISSLSSILSIQNYLECKEYLKTNNTLAAVPHLAPDISQWLLEIYQYLDRHEHTECGRRSYMKVAERVAQSFAYRFLSRKTISDEQLNAADIFHSPFYPLPERVLENKKIAKVITVHDLIPVLHPEYFQYREDVHLRKIMDGIDDNTWVTCVSQSTKDDLCGYLPALNPERVFVTHLAASGSFYRCNEQELIGDVRKRLGIPDGPYVLSLATLEPRKNIAQTIRCFLRIVREEKISNLSLVLVGTKGWDFDSIFNEINNARELRDRIVVTGYVPDKDLAPLYSGALMFVYPSFYEGFGLPPLEAMQCGVPVVTSNTSSLPEVVGNAAIQVAPGDSTALCQAMLDVIQSDTLRSDMMAASIEQARKFSWQKCAQDTIQAYRAALA